LFSHVKRRNEMSTQAKAYKGVAMEGFIASWYAKNTARDVRRFRDTAREVSERVPSGARVLEVAPGPGYLAIELARRGYEVVGLDISKSFVDIARQNAARAGVAIRFEHGDAAHMPFRDGSFDFAVCTAAFKNFSDPVGALDEIHRVLKPGGRASIIDLRKDASPAAIREEIRGMNLSRLNAALVRWTFQTLLLRNAYTREALEQMARRSKFGGCEIVEQGIGFDLRLARANA
jgi:ubiquinone/menaquinone biosynthesis C-methylase UbiE